MRLAIVFNTSAGTFLRQPPGPLAEGIAGTFKAAGHTVETIICGRRDLAGTLSTQAQRDDLDAVVCGGGDGTVLTAILAGLGRERPLGILPLGTLNLLARDLGLPLDPIEAAATLASGRAAAIDLAEVNGLPFAIWASLGMHPWIVRRRDKLQREGLRKWPAFALAALRAFRRYPLVRATLSVGDHQKTVTTPLLVISNNAWKERRLPLTREALDRGELVVHVAKVQSRLGLLWLALRALVGVWNTSGLLDTFKAHEVRVISRKRRAMVSLDGEVTVLRSPLVFRSRARGLFVLMPADRK
ncbi:lipid kinase MamU [Magnetospirillum aberrantis]|uniref:Sphingosine kinase n=1 Tax=Magnetospirillum aberrantis SpK TaxID=908842 RepID=A0A7C9UT51_9PROT|nr:lipid kinase MamU [Magnetospirillum aberrantis]NFV79788.1 sphingosine kinase [Magnetospirillum aberrantis SpK]